MTEERKDRSEESHLLEYATLAASAAGAAYFFGGKELNDSILKTRLYFNSISELVQENFDDLTQLDKTKLDAALDTAKVEYARLKEAGTNKFRGRNTPTLSILMELQHNIADENKTFRYLYNQQAQSMAFEVLEKHKGIISEEAYSKIQALLPTIVRNSKLDDNGHIVNGNFLNVKKEIGKTLDKYYAQAIEIVPEIMETAGRWMKDNPYNEWISGEGSEIKNVIIDEMRNYEERYNEQEYRKGVSDWVENLVNKDKNLTVEDIIDIMRNGEDSEKEKLRNLFVNDFLLTNDTGNTLGQQGKHIGYSKHSLLDMIVNEAYYLEHTARLNKTDEEISAIEKQRLYFGKLEINGLKLDSTTKKVYTTVETKSLMKSGAEALSKNFPFNLFHTNDIAFNSKRHNSYMQMGVGTLSPVMATLTGSNDVMMHKTAIVIEHKAITIDKNGSIKVQDIPKDITFISSKAGLGKSVYGKYAQGAARKEYFDTQVSIATDGLVTKVPYALEGFDFKAPEISKKDERFGDNVGLFDPRSEKFWLTAWDEKMKSTDNAAIEIMSSFDRFNSFLKENIFSMSEQSAKALKESLDPQKYSETIRYLDLIIKAGKEENLESVISELADVGDVEHAYHNHGIAKMVRDFSENIQKSLVKFEVGKDPKRTSKGTYISKEYRQLLQAELEKELFFNLNEDQKMSFNDILEMLNSSLQTDERTNAKNMLAVSVYQRESGISSWNGSDILKSYDFFKKRMENFHSNSRFLPLVKQIESLIDRFHGIGGTNESVLNPLSDVIDDGESVMDSVFYREEEMMPVRAPSFRVVKQAVQDTYKDVIKDLNDGHFEKAAKNVGKRLMNLGRNFFSGLGSEEARTHYSLLSFPFSHLFNRLNNGMNATFGEFGIFDTNINARQGFEGMYVRGGGLLASNILLKRIMPFMAAYGAYNIIEDATKNSVGTSPTEGVVSSFGNAWLGVKKITGAVGLDEGLKSLTRDNALINYIASGGEHSGEWQTYEEKKHYYEKGYDPIRKSRFWLFGSSNEFRGGKISYWEPNTYRMLKSDYLNKSLYNGSLVDKYNPFVSLEELHYNDRPYPISGAPFDEMTPWGMVLNPVAALFGFGRERMHEDRLQNGVDIKALIWHMNQQIRDKAENANDFYLQEGRLNSVTFNAYNAPTYDEAVLTATTDNQRWFNQYQKFNGSIPLSEITGNEKIYGELLSTEDDPYLRNQVSLKDRIETSAAEGNDFAEAVSLFMGHPSLDIIRSNNEKIRNKAESWDREIKAQGFISQNKLSLERSPIEEMIENQDEVAELLSSGSASDFINDAAVSMRMMSGFYGYMLKNATDIGANNGNRIATSQNMTSFSRMFWDENLGGLGGEQMEIYRRFFPEYKRFQTINPLMNEMPDWMPERFRFGDPYAAVPKGEARMPGAGYESLNELHSDIFGRYGAFDRFKILADVAAFSPEYKFWKKVAEKTVTNPELREEMEEIKARVREQSKQHDFMKYKYVGRGSESNRFYISEVLSNGQFKVFGSDETFKMAGITVKANQQEDTRQVLSRYLRPGELVTVITDTNEAYGRNTDKARSINAAVKIDGENISRMMINSGDAKERKGDQSTASYMADHGTMVNALNYLTEGIMHMDIPVLHNRWLRANDALEDYLDDYIYGTSFQSWDDILQTFIIPNMNKAASSNFWTAAGIAADIIKNNAVNGTNDKNNVISAFIANNFDIRRYTNRTGDAADISSAEIRIPGTNKHLPKMSKIATAAMQFHRGVDRGALMGWLTAKFTRFGASGVNKIGETVGERIGTMATLGYTAAVAPENFSSVMAMSRFGWLVGQHFGKYRNQIALASTAVGAIRWANEKTAAPLNDGRENIFIPDKVKKRWDMQEYFDRLTYIKYMGLFEQASEEALDKEGVDIKRIILKQEEEKGTIKETKNFLLESIDKLKGIQGEKAANQREYLEARLEGLSPVKAMFSGGEYAKSAVLYYNAAKSTMYGLDENSSMADIIRALPKTDREYFMEFVKEKDDEKRKEIMNYASPQIRRALKMIWKKEEGGGITEYIPSPIKQTLKGIWNPDFDEPESNESYFENHYLPAPTWGGFSPDVDLEDVKAKVIKNEAMTASDFGIYSSQYDEPGVINAPALDYRGSSDNILVRQLKLSAALNGAGLIGVNVSVEPSNDSIIQVIANVSRVIPYNVEQSINSFFGDNL